MRKVAAVVEKQGHEGGVGFALLAGVEALVGRQVGDGSAAQVEGDAAVERLVIGELGGAEIGVKRGWKLRVRRRRGAGGWPLRNFLDGTGAKSVVAAR